MGTFISNHKNNYNDIKRAVWTSLGDLQEYVEVLERRNQYLSRNSDVHDPSKAPRAQALSESFLGQAKVQHSLFLNALANSSGSVNLGVQEQTESELAARRANIERAKAEQEVLLGQSAALIYKALEALCQFIDDTGGHVASGRSIRDTFEKIEPVAEEVLRRLAHVSSVRDPKVSHEKYGQEDGSVDICYITEVGSKDIQRKMLLRFSLCDLVLQLIQHIDDSHNSEKQVRWLKAHAQVLRNIAVLEEKQAENMQKNIRVLGELRSCADQAAKQILDLLSKDELENQSVIVVEPATSNSGMRSNVQKQLIVNCDSFQHKTAVPGLKKWDGTLMLSVKIDLASEPVPGGMSLLASAIKRKELARHFVGLLLEHSRALDAVFPEIPEERSEYMPLWRLIRDQKQSEVEAPINLYDSSSPAKVSIISAQCSLKVIESSYVA